MGRPRILVFGLVLAALLVGPWVAPTWAQVPNTTAIAPPFLSYSVKFLCGEFEKFPSADRNKEGPVKPGNYLTAINIHNPNTTPVTFLKKAIVMFADQPNFPREFELPRKPGPFVKAALPPNWGMEIDCADIRAVLLQNQIPPPVFIKGWVVIVVPGRRQTLDVVTAYTAHGFKVETAGAVPQPEGFALEIERATPTTILPGGSD